MTGAMQTYMAWAVPLLVILVGVLVGYLAGYTKKRGENKAMHDDLDKLLDQVRAVTTTTKEIEARISDDVWDRQKRWELKCDLLIDAMKRINAVKYALAYLHGIYSTDKQSANPNSPSREAIRSKSEAEWSAAANKLDESFFLVEMVCGDEITKAVGGFALFVRKLSNEIMGAQPEALQIQMKDFTSKLGTLRAAMKKEIGATPLPARTSEPPTQTSN